MGGGTKDTVSRLFDIDDSEEYSNQLFKSLSLKLTPSSILLPVNLKSKLLKKQFQDVVEDCLNFQNFGEKLFCNEGESFYMPFHSFDIFSGKAGHDEWGTIFLLSYMRSVYPSTYRIKNLEDLFFCEDKDYNRRIIFVEGLS